MIDDESLRSLEKLHEMKTAGIITEADFEQAKARLLQGRSQARAKQTIAPPAPYPEQPAENDSQQWIVYALRRYAVFHGRSRRKEFWMFQVTIAVVALIFFLSISGEASVGPNPVAICSGLALLALLVPNLAVQVRRFHDQEKTGWFALLNLVPYVGPFIVMGFMLADGTPGENMYGPDPKERDNNL